MSDNEFAKRLAEMVSEGKLMHVVDVDAEGQVDGEPLNARLEEGFVASGYGINAPCVIRYPDGQLDIGHRISFTSAGIEWLRQEQEAGRF